MILLFQSYITSLKDNNFLMVYIVLLCISIMPLMYGESWVTSHNFYFMMGFVLTQLRQENKRRIKLETHSPQKN